jgi:sugar phosphate isomerase/epimerase
MKSFSRRKFVAGLGAGAVVLSNRRGFAATGQRGITFGFSTYGMKTLKTEKAVKMLAGIGFDSVELNVWDGWDADSAKLPKARQNAIRAALADHGLLLTGLMEKLNNKDTAGDQKRILDRLRLAAELGRKLSPDHQPVIQSTLSGKKWEDMKGIFLRQLEAWAKVAEREKTVIAIKPHRGGALSRPSEAVWLIEKLGRPKWLRMCYDYSHYDFRGMTLEDTIKIALPYTAHIAIKDAIEVDGRVRFVNPGLGGRIDYARLIRLFHAGGYRGDVCCEVSGQVWNVKGYDPVASAKQCYRSIAPAFKKAGVKRA